MNATPCRQPPCHTRAYTKSLHTTAEIDEFSRYFPVDPPTTAKALRDVKALESVHFTIEGLAPGSTVLYFATSPSKVVMEDKTKAYNKCRNQGMRKADKYGRVNGYLRCPSVYVNPNDGKAHPRHLHYTVWDSRAKAWSRQLRTLQIFATVEYDRTRGFVLVDARPRASYEERHIPGALSLPYDEPVTSRKVKALLKGTGAGAAWRHTPMILYCQNAACNASEKLRAKLAKIEVVNTWHYADGMDGWDLASRAL